MKLKSVLWGLGLTLVVGINACGWLTCLGMRSRQKTENPTSETKVDAAPSTPIIQVKRCTDAEICFLFEKGATLMPLFESEEKYSEAVRAASRKDEIGYKAAVSVAVPLGTRVLVLDTGWEKAQVRVLEGRHFGFAGWVMRSEVVPALPFQSESVAPTIAKGPFSECRWLDSLATKCQKKPWSRQNGTNYACTVQCSEHRASYVVRGSATSTRDAILMQALTASTEHSYAYKTEMAQWAVQLTASASKTEVSAADATEIGAQIVSEKSFSRVVNGKHIEFSSRSAKSASVNAQMLFFTVFFQAPDAGVQE